MPDSRTPQERETERRPERPGPATPACAPDRRFATALAVILLAGSIVRVAYTLAQAAVDPWFAQPVLDARYYVDWAGALAAGRPGPEGAFYLAPLYPYLLAVLIAGVGQNYGAIYAAQHAMTVASAALIALGGRRVLGPRAALAAAALLLLHHPILFFAARPLGETLAILLLLASVVAAWREGPRAAFAAGLLAGLGSLARPNLLLVPLAWGAGHVRASRWSQVVALAAGLAVVILPVTLRNFRVSGHLVPISSNGGLTAYHGNGPGARGIYTHPDGFSFDLSRQRESATEIARVRSGLDLDAVEADGFWGRQAVRARLDRPFETLGLLAWRVALTVGDREFGLDYPPLLDPNPWRLTLRGAGGFEVALVPWALLLGLAGAGVVRVGFRPSGGFAVWSALLACAATPVLFYFSSRYRLPAAALLAIPAGAGLAALTSREHAARPRSVAAWVVAPVLLLVSLLVPSGGLHRLERAGGLVNRAGAYLREGKLVAAEADVRQALALDPGSPRARVVLGEVLLSARRYAEAEAAFREGLRLADIPEAAPGLAASLWGQGRLDEALGVLRRALVLRPGCEACWNALVAVLYASGDARAARLAAEQAAQSGVALDPQVLERLGHETGSREGGAPP